MEVREKEWKRDKTVQESQNVSKDKEIAYLQEKIDRLSDPITVKFEKDGLINTYKKRIGEIEEYVKKLEE